MKTYNKLTSTDKTVLSNKSAINYNLQILSNIFDFVLKKIADPEVLQAINELLESFLENLDNIISKHLQPHENDDEKDTTCSAN